MRPEKRQVNLSLKLTTRGCSKNILSGKKDFPDFRAQDNLLNHSCQTESQKSGKYIKVVFFEQPHVYSTLFPSQNCERTASFTTIQIP
jgi:hypothetical protein